jgi:hypothetical protein
MNRSEFFRTSVQLTCASCLALVFGSNASAPDAPAPAAPPTPVDEALKQAQGENAFINNWLTDLFEAIDTEVDPAVQRKLLQACGRGCYRRHKFKQEIAAAGKDDPEKLIAAYRKNFRIEREGGLVHATDTTRFDEGLSVLRSL